MWWQMIPSMILTGGFLTLPPFVVAGVAYVYNGSIHGRSLGEYVPQFLIFRDRRILNGANPLRQHKHLGLDGIPDS